MKYGGCIEGDVAPRINCFNCYMNDPIDINYLFERIADNDPKAFQLFFDYTYPTAYRYVSYFVSDMDLCKDIISDVYAYIWHHRENLKDIQKYENYLFICIKNRSYHYLNDCNRHQKIRLDNTAPFDMPDDVNPERSLLHSELKDVIELAINTLPQRCRLIFFMIKEEGMKYREVAEILSISERTVQAQMCIALKRIRIVVKNYLDTISE